MGAATFASNKPRTMSETERQLQNVLAAKRSYDSAVEARSKLVGKILKEDPHSVSVRRQAFDHEQRSLETYVRALREYNDLVVDGKSS